VCDDPKSFDFFAIDRLPGWAAEATGELQILAYQNDEVIGLDKDGHVVQWNGDNDMPVDSGESLERFGLHNLREHEFARVGVVREAWEAAVAAQAGKLPENAAIVDFVTQRKHGTVRSEVTSKAKLDMATGNVFDLESPDDHRYVAESHVGWRILVDGEDLPASSPDGSYFVVGRAHWAAFCDRVERSKADARIMPPNHQESPESVAARLGNAVGTDGNETVFRGDLIGYAAQAAARELVKSWSDAVRDGNTANLLADVDEVIATLAAFKEQAKRILPSMDGVDYAAKQTGADYSVSVDVEVTAESPAEAARSALDDLRDETLEVWAMDVTCIQSGVVTKVSVPGCGKDVVDHVDDGASRPSFGM
jgi:hypothetical protein